MKYLTMLSPSEILRADYLVWMEMPINPLSCAIAAGARAMRPATAAANIDLILFTLSLPSLW